MKRYGRNTLIKTLRELGVSDKERKEMRELAKEFEAQNVYKEVDKINQQVLGESIRPATLNYENMIRTMSYTGKDFSEILDEYRETLRNLESGTTNEAQQYYQNVVADLERLGFYVSNETIQNIDQNGLLDELIERIIFLQRYETISNKGGVRAGSQLDYDIENARTFIEQIIGFYEL